MTWQITFAGHEAPWDASTEKATADIGRTIVEALKAHGLSSARFGGNFYQEDYLQDTYVQPPEAAPES